jgi:threonine/homoserine/homoserine lactone efflux protein
MIWSCRISAMHSFVSFLAVSAVLLVIPGPDTFVVLRTSLADGPRAGTWAAAGSATGNLVWGTLSVLGVAALLAASAAAFATLKLAGAVYLAALGVQALLAARRGEPLARTDAAARALSPAVAFRRGLASDLLNVKAGLFWTALVPQVLATGGPLLPVAMITAMVALVCAWLTGYAHLAARLSATLRSRRAARAVNGAVGAVLVALGVSLALVRH